MSQAAHGDVPAGRALFTGGGVVFGVGLGGLADGIVLHQVLQWHNLVSQQVTNQTVEGLRSNLFWDGVFHLTTTALVVVGVALLWGSWRHPRRASGNTSAVAGLALIGWGAFHVVDQLLFHELLNLHNIREGVETPGLYNWGFLAGGLLLAAAGRLLYRSRGRVAASALGSAPRPRTVDNSRG